MARPVGSTLPAPDKLSEALLGLCLLALDRPRAEHPRLVEQFRAQYPEIVLEPSRFREALAYIADREHYETDDLGNDHMLRPESHKPEQKSGVVAYSTTLRPWAYAKAVLDGRPA